MLCFEAKNSMTEKLTVKMLLSKHHLSLHIICILARVPLEEGYALYHRKPVSRTIAEHFLAQINQSAGTQYILEALDIPLGESRQDNES